MATVDETSTSELPSFSSIKPFEQRAVVLKASGQTNEVIANQINAEFGLAYKSSTVAEWFWASGRLLQAYQEYNSKLADQAVAEAKNRIKKASAKAAETLEDLMHHSYEGGVRVRAALGVLAKYVPDRQVIVDGGKESELPAELSEAIDEELDDLKPEEGASDDNPSPGPEVS